MKKFWSNMNHTGKIGNFIYIFMEFFSDLLQSQI